ncbi:MAG: hypothetical protein ACLGIO_00660 [Acidimicrobiia bacterium]
MAAEPIVARRPAAPSRIASLAAEVVRRSPPAVVTARTSALAVGAVVAGAGTALARQQGPGALDTVWAEDGAVFLAQVHDLGVGGSLLEPYAGYLHAVPRLIAAVVSALPLQWADTAYAALSALVTAGCAVFVFRASAAHVAGRWARVACAAPILVSPLAGTEVLANAANLHWFLLSAAFWAVVWRAPSRWESAVAASVVAAAALSDPFALALLPLAALRLAPRRRPDAVASAFAVAAVVQVAGALTADSGRQLGEKAEVALVPFRYVVDVFGRGLAGDRVVGQDGLSSRGVVVGGLVLGAVAALAFARRHAVRRRAPFLAAAGLVSVAYFTAPVALSGISTSRYALAPALLVIAALAVLVDDGGRSPRRRRMGAPGAAGLAALAVCWAVGLPSHNHRDTGPAWDEALAAAAASCTPGSAAAVEVLPDGLTAELPCDDVVEAARR